MKLAQLVRQPLGDQREFVWRSLILPPEPKRVNLAKPGCINLPRSAAPVNCRDQACDRMIIALKGR